MMMADFGKIEQFTEHVSAVIQTNYELNKYELAEHASSLGSRLLSHLIIGFLGVLFVVLLSMGMGFYLSEYFGNHYIGFFMVAGFYFLAGFVLILIKKSCLYAPFRKIIIRNLFEHESPNYPTSL